MKDLFSKVKLVRAISPVSVGDDTAQVSEILDRTGFESVMLGILTGSIGDSNATFAVLLEESDNADMSGGNAVADGDLHGTEALAGFQYDDDNECRKLGYRGTKRYLRATITPSGNGSAALIAAFWQLGHPHSAPQSSQAT